MATVRNDRADDPVTFEITSGRRQVKAGELTILRAQLRGDAADDPNIDARIDRVLLQIQAGAIDRAIDRLAFDEWLQELSVDTNLLCRLLELSPALIGCEGVLARIAGERNPADQKQLLKSLRRGLGWGTRRRRARTEGTSFSQLADAAALRLRLQDEIRQLKRRHRQSPRAVLNREFCETIVKPNLPHLSRKKHEQIATRLLRKPPREAALSIAAESLCVPQRRLRTAIVQRDR